MLALVWEVFHMSVFIALASYCLHFFAYKKGLSEDRDDILQTKNNDDIENANGFSIFDIVLDKWLNFGGGYYGTVAFVKLIGIEILQLRDLIANWQDTGHFLTSLAFK